MATSRIESALIKRRLILKLRKEGKSFQEISLQTGVSSSSVAYVINKFEEFGTVRNRMRMFRKYRGSSRLPVWEPEVNIHVDESKIIVIHDRSQSLTSNSVEVNRFRRREIRVEKPEETGDERMESQNSSEVQPTVDYSTEHLATSLEGMHLP